MGTKTIYLNRSYVIYGFSIVSAIINSFAINYIGTSGSFWIAVGINSVEFILYVVYTYFDLNSGITDNFYKFKGQETFDI